VAASTSQAVGHVAMDFLVGGGGMLEMDWLNGGFPPGAHFLSILYLSFFMSICTGTTADCNTEYSLHGDKNTLPFPSQEQFRATHL